MQQSHFLKSLLKDALIKHNVVDDFDKYTVFSTDGKALFSVGFNPKIQKYGFGRTKQGSIAFQLHAISDETLKDFALVYNTVKRQYQIEMVSFLFNEIIKQSEMNAFESQDSDTYFAESKFGRIFSITFDKKTKKYELKRSKMLKYLYDALEIPFDIEPENTKELFDTAKTEYTLQVVRETVESMYDFVPDYYDLIR